MTQAKFYRLNTTLSLFTDNTKLYPGIPLFYFLGRITDDDNDASYHAQYLFLIVYRSVSDRFLLRKR